MTANIIIEMASDGGFSCYAQESFDGFALFGYGDTVAETKRDLLDSFMEIKELMEQEGKQVPELEFVYHYDMKSFFDYFDFLNVSKVAERAGINPSLMRKYTSGVAKAGDKQYAKLSSAVKSFASELQSASF